jgi:hypothetical protein
MGQEAFDDYLQEELSRYRDGGLPVEYQHELRL